MRHSLRVASALAGVTLAVPAVVIAQSMGAVVPRLVAAPPRRPVPPAANPPRCPRAKPAYGSNCAAALRDTQCAYDVPGGARVAYTCRATRPNQAPYWATGQAPSRGPQLDEAEVMGPLPPPELPA